MSRGLVITLLVLDLTACRGKVSVDGQMESRKTRKVRAGQAVGLHGVRIQVRAAAAPADVPKAASG